MQCKDFETKRQFCLDFVDHIVYYKNLVELHGYVPIKAKTDSESDETPTVKIEYKITDEIEWAVRFANYRKKGDRTRISLRDFNNVVGKSKRRMKDVIIPDHNRK